jgi:hypothetical protein
MTPEEERKRNNAEKDSAPSMANLEHDQSCLERPINNAGLITEGGNNEGQHERPAIRGRNMSEEQVAKSLLMVSHKKKLREAISNLRNCVKRREQLSEFLPSIFELEDEEVEDEMLSEILNDAQYAIEVFRRSMGYNSDSRLVAANVIMDEESQI